MYAKVKSITIDGPARSGAAVRFPTNPTIDGFVCRRRLGDQRTRFDRHPAANARSGR
jgi:hypothetical protein